MIVSKSVSLEIEDLLKIEKKVREEKVEFIHGIVEQPWKQKVMIFYDYDKNIIEVGERLEHLTEEGVWVDNTKRVDKWIKTFKELVDWAKTDKIKDSD